MRACVRVCLNRCGVCVSVCVGGGSGVGGGGGRLKGLSVGTGRYWEIVSFSTLSFLPVDGTSYQAYDESRKAPFLIGRCSACGSRSQETGSRSRKTACATCA